MNKTAKAFLIILPVIAGLIYASVQTSTESKNSEENITLRDYLLNNFLAELPNINSKLPYKIDADTVLLSIEYLNGKVVSRYELPNLQSTMISTKQIEMKLLPELQKQGCLDESKMSLIGIDVEFLSRYQDSNGAILFEVPLNKKICSAFISSD